MLVQEDIYRKVTFADVDNEPLFLLPPSIQECLLEKHLARFMVETVEQIDLQPFKASYCGRGSQPYNQEMLVALLSYGYATRVFSSRKLERSTYDSVAFRCIVARYSPSEKVLRAKVENWLWFLMESRGLTIYINDPCLLVGINT